MSKNDSTTIRVSFDTKEQLSKRGKHGESFDQIITSLMRGRK